MYKKTFEISGKIIFDPVDFTNKQKTQSAWKKVALIMIDEGDLAAYYRWFLEKRYNLFLNPPARGSHVTFINDSLRDMGENVKNWESLKKQWNGQTVPLVLETEIKTDSNHWWLNIPQDERESIHFLRSQLGLGRPFFGLHMTVGLANEKNAHHSQYIHGLYKKGFLNLDII